MHQVTLISLYGEKSKAFSDLVTAAWEAIEQSKLRRFFRAYDIRQIHGTFVGMEKVLGYRRHFNLNLKQSVGELTDMTFDHLRDTVCGKLPMDIQIGGFAPDFDSFQSMGKKPYVRSFQVQWRRRKVTLIGWPFETQGDSRSYERTTLLDLRDDMKRACNIQHKYPRPKYEDNDLFMVIGELANLQLASDEELYELEKTVVPDVEKLIRDHLWANPIIVRLGEQHVFAACYTNETLPLDSTEVYSFADGSLDTTLLNALYVRHPDGIPEHSVPGDD